MHKLFVQVYVFVLIIWAVEKSDCKQGGHQNQLMNAEDFDFYNGAACLNYGHSCWGAHGKRNVGGTNDIDTFLRYRMALLKKSGRRDSYIDPNTDQSQDIPNYYNIFKHYSKINSMKTNNDDTVDTWSLEPNNNLPSGKSYYEDQVLDPRIEYKIMKI